MDIIRRAMMTTGIVLALIAPVAPGHGASDVDWAYATLTAGPHGMGSDDDAALYTEIALYGFATLTADGPNVMGVAPVVAGTGGNVHVFNVSDGNEIVTTGPLGGMHLKITPREPRRIFYLAEFILVRHLEPGEQFGALLFFGNAELETVPKFHMIVQSGTASPSIRFGGGTTVMRFADPEHGGAAIATGSQGAGVDVATATTTTGIVGGFVTDDCHGCVATFLSPDGHTGVLAGDSSTLLAGTGFGAFAGPAGDWLWTVAGHMTGTPSNIPGTPVPLIGAYVPIGDAWTIWAG